MNILINSLNNMDININQDQDQDQDQDENQLNQDQLNQDLDQNEISDEEIECNCPSCLKWISKIKNEISLYKIFNGYITHKMYLVDYIKNENEIYIKIIGGLNKKNQQRESYQINLNLHYKNFTCTCKDFLYRSQMCKHIMFLVFKVTSKIMLFPHFRNEFLETKRLTSDQLNNFINIIESNKVWNSNYSLNTVNKQFKNPNLDINLDLCAICYEKLSTENSSEHSLLKCPECKKNVHEKCMEIWLTQQKTCVYCRSSVFSSYIKINIKK
jgi:hypothetical protein